MALEAVGSVPLPYLVHTPESRSGAEPYPLLCFLHGYDEGPPAQLREGPRRHGPLAAGAAPVAKSDFIVVAPQLPARGDHWGRFAGAVLAIVRDVQHRHGGDPDRTYLTGFSFGANGVFDLALAQPHAWAALWPVDPTRVPVADPGRPVWLSSGEVSRRSLGGFISRLGLRWREAGPTSDRILEERGEDHVGTAARAYGSARVYRWLLSWGSESTKLQVDTESGPDA